MAQDMIKEDYVSFEVARLLKDKGFDQNCATYYLDGQVWRHYHGEVIPKDKQIYAAPTQAIAMKWLREIHDIDFDINTTGSRHVRRYHLAIWENKDEEMVTINPIGYFNKWEQACEAAIKYCLENLI